MSNNPIPEVIRTEVPNLASYLAANLPPDITTDTLNQATSALTNLIQTYISLNANIDMPLANISVDYETNKAEMMSILAQAGTGSWQDTIITGTGQTLTEMVATALTYMQFNIVRAAQETMMDTMTLINSIYAGVRHLGQRILRRYPGNLTATLTRKSANNVTLTIPAYTAFNINNVYYFNRDEIIFNVGISNLQNVILYEGQLFTTSFTSDGTAFQAYVFGNSDYTISNVDVIININNTVWAPTVFNQYFNIGLWEFGSTSQVYSDYTTSDGNVEIRFGNGIYGQVPAANQAINITFATTSGASGNQDLTGSAIACTGFSSVIGVVTSPTTNGSDPLTPGTYKNLGPGSYAAKYRASTRSDYKDLALQYPGILDAIFLGQQDFAPFDLSQMMIIKPIIITNTPWGTSQFNSFTTWLNNIGIANAQYVEQTPFNNSISITVDVFCFDNANLDTIENKITSNVNAAFAPKAGSLGYNWFLSDIDKIVSNSDTVNIDYIEILEPTSQEIPSVAPFEEATTNSAGSGSTVLAFASPIGLAIGQTVTGVNIPNVNYVANFSEPSLSLATDAIDSTSTTLYFANTSGVGTTQTVTGLFIPTLTTATSFDSTSVVLSNPIYGSNVAAGENITFQSPSFNITTNATSASNFTTLYFASTTGVANGQSVTGTNVGIFSTVTSFNSTSVILSSPTIGTIASGQTITFQNQPLILIEDIDSSSTSTLFFSSTTSVSVGNSVASNNVAALTSVSSLSSTSVVLSNPVNGTITNGQTIVFNSALVTLSLPTSGTISLGETITFITPSNYGYVSLDNLVINMGYSTRQNRGI